MAQNVVATLAVNIVGSFAKFSTEIKNLEKTFGQISKSVNRVSGKLTKGLAVPLGAIGGAAIAAAKSVDDAFDTIRASTGKTGTDLEALTTSFENVFSQTTLGAEETAKAISDISNGLNLSGKPLEDLATQAAGASQVLKQDLGATVKGTISIMNAWKVSTDEQTSVMDFLFKASQRTGQNIGELASNVAAFQPTLSRLGMGIKEGAALFGILGKNGVEAGQVMNALNTAVLKFAGAGVKDMGAALKLTFGALKNASSDTEAITQSVEIFGKKAGPRLASLIRSGTLSLEDFVKSIDDSGDSIEKAVRDTDGFTDKLVKLRNALTTALAPIGNPILEQMAKGIDLLKPKIKELGDAFKALDPDMQRFIVLSGTIVAILGPTIKAISFFFGWLKNLGPVIAIVTAGIGALVGAVTFLFTPMGALAALIALVASAWYNWDKVGPFIKNFTSETIDSFNNLMEMLSKANRKALDSFNDFVYDTADYFAELRDRVIVSVADFAQGVIDYTVDMKDRSLAAVQELVEGVTNWFTGKFNSARDSIQGFADSVYGIFVQLKAKVLDNSPVPDLIEGVGAEFGKLGEKMIPPTKAAAEGVLSSFTALFNAVKSKNKEGEKEAKKFSEAWKRVKEDLKSVMSDINQEMDPLRKNITELLKAKDFSGLEKLAESFRGSTEGLEQFRKSLGDAKGDFEEWDRNEKELNKTLEETRKELYELSTGKKLIDPLTESIAQMMQAGDMAGIEKLGRSMLDTEENAQKFKDSLSEAKDVMREMKQDSEELAGSLAEGLGGMFQNFGMSSGLSNMISGIFSGAVTGTGKGGLGQIGNWINGQLGGGNIFEGILGPSSSSPGGSDIFSSIMEGLGFGGPGESEAAASIAKVEGATNGLTQSMDGLGSSMSTMGSYVEVANESLQSLGKIGKSTKDTFEGGGQMAGAAIGAYFGGPVGAQIGSAVGKEVGSFLGDMVGGAPKNKQTLARKEVEKFLEDALKGKRTSFAGPDGTQIPFDGNIRFGSTDRFNKPGWAEANREKFGNESTQTFDAIGRGLKEVLGITEDIGPQIGAILQEQLSGNIDNARKLMRELGVSQEDMTAAFEKAGEQGTMSWHAVEVALQGVANAFGEGLVAQGDFVKGFRTIVESGGDGKDAIDGIKIAAHEAAERGIKDFAQWKQMLLDAGETPEYVNAFFDALSSRQIKNFEEIKNASTRVLGGVIADMQSNSSALADVWIKAQQESQKYLETITNIPDESTKNVTLNVKANLDSNSQKVLDMPSTVSSSTTTSSNIPKLADGGIATRATLGIFGEAGPEAILPLSVLPKMLRSMNSDMGEKRGNGINLTIDARGAGPGVSDEIRRVVGELEHNLVTRTVDLIEDMARRTGH